MKCLRHSKEAEYQCQWCGKKICELCIGKTDGKKVYCHDCYNKIGHIRRDKLPQQAKKEEPKEKKLPRTEDGYLVLGDEQ